MTISITYLNGSLPTAAELAPLAFAGYAHFTAMQVREGSLRGLDLHLERLRSGSQTLYGHHLPDQEIIGHINRALLAAPANASLTVHISSRPGEFLAAAHPPELDVLVKITDPVNVPIKPISLDLVQHERHLAEVKHVGEVSKTLYLRRAKERGYDDAAFMDRSGRLSEATIWNIALWDGTSVIWPDADILSGVTMQILQRQLRVLGVRQVTQPISLSALAEPLAAVVMNSWSPGIPVSRIGNHPVRSSPEFVGLLHEAYEAEPLARP